MVLCPTMLEILWNFPLRFIVIHPVCVNHACGGIRAHAKRDMRDHEGLPMSLKSAMQVCSHISSVSNFSKPTHWTTCCRERVLCSNLGPDVS